MYFMRDFENVEFKRRRGPLSAITKSKIARALRGKGRKPRRISPKAAAIRTAKLGAVVGGLEGLASGLKKNPDGTISYDLRKGLGRAARESAIGAGSAALSGALIAKAYNKARSSR